MVGATGLQLRTELGASAERFVTGVGKAEAVGVGVVGTVHICAAYTTTSGTGLAFGQGYAGNARGHRYASYTGSNAADRSTAPDLLICHSP